MRWDDRIGRRLKLRDLHVLLAVVQNGSMTKAAAQLSVSNPVVSKAISDLEHTMGVRLLDRGPHGVEPTIYGSALLDRGLIVFDELRQAVKHIEVLADPAAGEVRIASSVSIGASFVSAVIDRVNRKHPRIAFDLLTAETAMTYRALEQRQVDLMIARIFGPIADDHMAVDILYHESQVVAAGAQYTWGRRRKPKLTDLMDEAWALPPPDSLAGSIVTEAFQAEGLPLPRTTVIASTVPVRNALLATGRFLSIIPTSVLRLPSKNTALRTLPIDLPTTRRPVGIVTLTGRTLSPSTQLFIDAAHDVAKSLMRE